MSNDPTADFFANARADQGQSLAEFGAVKKILKVCGVKRSSVATFAGLMQINFPMQLIYADLSKHDIRCAVNDLMRRPTRAGIYQAHTEALTQFPEMAGALGIVYKWRGSLMVFHDLEMSGNLGPFGIYVRIEDKQYFLERLVDLAEKLGPAEDW